MGSYGERESILEQFGQCQHVGIPALPPVGIRHDRRRYPPCRYLLDVVAIGIGSFQFPCGIDHDSKNPLRELIEKLQNINHQTRVITILGKGNKERKVAPSEDVWCRLEDWLKVRGEEGCENVFVAVKKGDNIQPYWAITASAIYQLLKSRADDSQVSAFTPHDLRRTFATRLLESGADINTVRQAMGHASIITTQRYDRRGERTVEEATRKVAL